MLKRIEDICLSVLGLALSAPFCLLIHVAIKLDSPGPVLFRQTRVGRNGRPFTLYKFRSMGLVGEAVAPLPLVIADFHCYVYSPAVPGRDPRVTRVGGFLRATSLDELPQLYNVLCGEMSLVGPRPEIPEIVAQYPPAYHRRHQVRPGITGIAQINGRSDLTYHQILLYDLDYVERHSWWRDLGILARTIGVVLTGRGAR